jgi:hypothetical protein
MRRAVASAARASMSTAAPPPPSARLPKGDRRPTPADALRWTVSLNAPPAALAPFVPWREGGATVGLVHPATVALLAPFEDVFVIDRAAAAPSLALHPSLATATARTAALARVSSALADAGVVTGWRGEPYPVAASFADPPLATIERAAAPLFGVRAYGVHVNGYVVDGAGDDPASIKLWVATRALTKPTWPGRLDHVVAGGQPAGLSPAANVVKECGEEAGVPEALARACARPVGCVSYASLLPAAGATPPCVKRDVLFVYDLRLPADFVPVPCDGEVAGFELLPLADVAALVAFTNEFKDNCNAVIADFLVRHGFWTPEEAGYLELVAGLRPGGTLV